MRATYVTIRPTDVPGVALRDALAYYRNDSLDWAALHNCVLRRIVQFMKKELNFDEDVEDEDVLFDIADAADLGGIAK